jgi:hypothetical protein
VEGLVSGWWIGRKGGLFCIRTGGKGGRVKEVAVIEALLFSLLWWVLYEQSLYGGEGYTKAGLPLCA